MPSGSSRRAPIWASWNARCRSRRRVQNHREGRDLCVAHEFAVEVKGSTAGSAGLLEGDRRIANRRGPYGPYRDFYRYDRTRAITNDMAADASDGGTGPAAPKGTNHLSHRVGRRYRTKHQLNAAVSIPLRSAAASELASGMRSPARDSITDCMSCSSSATGPLDLHYPAESLQPSVRQLERAEPPRAWQRFGSASASSGPRPSLGRFPPTSGRRSPGGAGVAEGMLGGPSTNRHPLEVQPRPPARAPPRRIETATWKLTVVPMRTSWRKEGPAAA